MISPAFSEIPPTIRFRWADSRQAILRHFGDAANAKKNGDANAKRTPPR